MCVCVCVCVCVISGCLTVLFTAFVMSEGVNGNAKANSECNLYIWRINFLYLVSFNFLHELSCHKKGRIC